MHYRAKLHVRRCTSRHCLQSPTALHHHRHCTHYNTAWQHTATLCNTLQHSATHCNALQQSATQYLAELDVSRCKRSNSFQPSTALRNCTHLRICRSCAVTDTTCRARRHQALMNNLSVWSSVT